MMSPTLVRGALKPCADCTSEDPRFDKVMVLHCMRKHPDCLDIRRCTCLKHPLQGTCNTTADWTSCSARLFH